METIRKSAHASLDSGTTSGVGSDFRTTGRLFGNITTSEIAPNITYLEHFITTTDGSRRKDHIVASQKTLTIPFTFDEINAANFRKFLMGTDKSASAKVGAPVFTAMDAALTYGSAQLYFKTDVGNDFVYMIPKCTIRPDGNLTMSAEDWWSGPMVLEVLNHDWAPDNIATPAGAINAPYGLVSMSSIS